MDENSSKNLDVEDFRWGLLDYGIQISKDDALEVLSKYDTHSTGLVHFPSFIDTLIVSFYFKYLKNLYYRETSTNKENNWLSKLMINQIALKMEV